MYDFCPVELLTNEHMISMAAALKPAIKCKLLASKEKLDIINVVDAT